MALNYDKMLKQTEKMHAAAKNGKTKFNGEKYFFTFSRRFGTYTVTNEDGVVITYLNTRKITVAKKWLREFLQN